MSSHNPSHYLTHLLTPDLDDEDGRQNANVLQWAPVWLKLAITSVLQHVGGIHSGCALSGAG